MIRRHTIALAVPVWARVAAFCCTFGFGFGVPAYAGHPADCRVSGAQTEIAFPLRHVEKAIANKKLSLLVVGAGSSQLPGPNGAPNSYPARLQQALSRLLPGVEVTLASDVKSKRTAVEMVKTLPASLAESLPALTIWQTATVDAMQSVDPEQFSQALDKGIHLARDAGSDVIIMNPQYSPRTDSIIALGTYVENMRWVAVQQKVPVFDRFGLMKAWYEQGTFDLYSATKKMDMAELVHDCIGRLLADLVIEAAKPDPASVDKGK